MYMDYFFSYTLVRHVTTNYFPWTTRNLVFVSYVKLYTNRISI